MKGWARWIVGAVLIVIVLSCAGCPGQRTRDTGDILTPPPTETKQPEQPWYHEQGTPELVGLLAGLSLRYDAPETDDLRLDGLLQAYGAELNRSSLPDIIVSRDNDKMVIRYHQSTRRVPRIGQGYLILVDRVVIEIAQDRLKRLAKDYDRQVVIDKDGTLSFRPTPITPANPKK